MVVGWNGQRRLNDDPNKKAKKVSIDRERGGVAQ